MAKPPVPLSAEEEAKRSAQISVLTELSEKLKEKEASEIAAGKASDDHAKALGQVNIALGAMAVLLVAASAKGTKLDESLGGVFTTIETTAKASLGVFEKSLDMLGEVYNTASKQGDKLRQEWREVQNFLGGGFGELGTAANKSQGQADEAVRGITDIYESFYRLIPETKVSMFELFEDEQELSSMYMSIANDTSRASKFLKGDTVAMTRDVAIGVKGLGLSVGQAREFIDRQIDITGEANTELLREMAKVTKATEAATGESSKIIAQNTFDMVKNVGNFGNMTREEMAATSAQLSQVGIDFQALNGIVGKFQSFEGAASAAADLNAVFGIQLDTMEMMTASNQGQHKVLDLVRQGMLDAGVTSSNLTDNMGKARVAAQSYGVSVDTLQRILAAQDASEIEEILKGQSEQITKAEEEAGTVDFGTKEFAEALDKDMSRSQRAIGKTAAQLKEMATNQATSAGLANLRSEFAQIAEDAERLSQTGVVSAGIMVAPMSEMAEGAMSGVAAGLNDSVKAINNSVKETALAVQESLIPIASKAGEAMGDSFRLKIYDPVGSPAAGGGDDAGRESGMMATPIAKIREGLEPIKEFADIINEEDINEEAKLFGAGLGMIMGEGVSSTFAEEVVKGISDLDVSSPEALGTGITSLIKRVAAKMETEGLAAGVVGNSPSAFGEGIADSAVEGIMLIPEKLEEALNGQALVDIDSIIAFDFDEFRTKINLASKDIVSSFEGLKDLNLTTPTLQPIDVNLTSRISELNKATQAIIDSKSAPLDLNINLEMVIDDEATASLIKKFKVGTVTGGERVLTVTT